MVLQGMGALQKALREAPELIKLELRRAVETTAFSIAQRMRATVRRDTGLLARNIDSHVKGLSGRVTIGVDAYYWQYLEYGTVRMAAKPFIRPSVELESLVFEQRLRNAAHVIDRDLSGMAVAA
jgi:HK97 gp10 family phage protein